MKLLRIILAGLVGGMAMFVCGAVVHMMTPIGTMGIKSMPQESSVLPALKGAVAEPGFYFFPGLADMKHASEADQKAWEEKYKAGPRGVLIIDPKGGEVMTPRQLGTEFATNAAACLLAAMIVACMDCMLLTRILVCVLIGVIGWLSISTSHMTWYLFPWEYTVGELLDQGIGWFAAGIPIALIVGRCKSPAAATST